MLRKRLRRRGVRAASEQTQIDFFCDWISTETTSGSLAAVIGGFFGVLLPAGLCLLLGVILMR